jgi:hypothetical protein
MTESSDATADDLADVSESSRREDGPSRSSKGVLERRVNYGRLVNVLAAVSERLEQKGDTVTEAQARIVMKMMRERVGDGVEAEQAEYRLDRLAEVTAKVCGKDEAFVGGVLTEVVEPVE